MLRCPKTAAYRSISAMRSGVSAGASLALRASGADGRPRAARPGAPHPARSGTVHISGTWPMPGADRQHQQVDMPFVPPSSWSGR